MWEIGEAYDARIASQQVRECRRLQVIESVHLGDFCELSKLYSLDGNSLGCRDTLSEGDREGETEGFRDRGLRNVPMALLEKVLCPSCASSWP